MRIEQLEGRQLFSSYYVDASAAGGGDGSLGAPFNSVSQVNTINLQAGDQVLLHGGDSFAGPLLFNAQDVGGLADGSRIAVSSYGSGRATIVGNNSSGIVASNTAGISISQVNVVGVAQPTNVYSGISFDNSLAGNLKLAGVSIDSVDVSGFGKYGITVGGSNGKSGFDTVRITNSRVSANKLGGIETHGVFSSTATGYANSNVYVGGCEVFSNPGFAGSSNHSGDGIVLSDADRLTIEYNEAYDNGAENTHVGGPVGIWVWDVNAATIQYNESHDNKTNSTADGGGFDLDGGVTNSVVQYNYSHDNYGAGYGIYQFAGARPFHDNVVRYNTSVNDGRRNSYGAIDFWNGDGTNGISNVQVSNNTVYVTPSTTTTTTYNRKGQPVTTTTTLGDPRALRFISGTTNVSLYNNIFQTTGGVMLAQIDAKQTNLQILGNDWWSSGAAFSLKSFAKVYTSFSAWVSGSGYEKQGTVTVGKNVATGISLSGDATRLGIATLRSLQSQGQALGASGLLDALRASGSTLNNGGVAPSTFGASSPATDFFGVAVAFNSRDIGAGEL